MTNTVSVSVIIPAFNAERTLDLAVGSVLSGDFQDFEIVICDDASTDRTRRVVKGYSDPRIRLVCNKRTLGPGASRNHAISESRGNWIALLDADDAYRSDRLKSLMEIAVRYPDCIIFDEIMECHDTFSGIHPWRPVRHRKAYPGTPHDVRPVCVADWIGQHRPVISPLIPVSAIRDHGVMYSHKACSEDLEFLLKVLALSGAGLWYVPKPMYLYRISPGSLSTNANRYALTAATMRDVAPLFSKDPETREALLNAEKRFLIAGEYRKLLIDLRKRRFRKAIKMILHNHWMAREMILRGTQQLPYLISRAVHGGRRRTR